MQENEGTCCCVETVVYRRMTALRTAIQVHESVAQIAKQEMKALAMVLKRLDGATKRNIGSCAQCKSCQLTK